jgi:hypothetical protein
VTKFLVSLAYFTGFDEAFNLFVESLAGKISGDKVEGLGGAKMATQWGIVATLDNFQSKIRILNWHD